MEKLCGKCSQAKGLTLDERIELSQSRIANAVYTCPVCMQEHVYLGYVVKRPTPIETAEEQVTQEEKTKIQMKTNNNGDQLSLF